MRIELRLRGEQLDRDQILMRRQVEDDVERALKVPRGTVEVRDVFGSGRYLVVDIHAATSQLGGTEAVQAALLAEELQMLVQDMDGTSPLRDGDVTSQLDPLAGAQMLLPGHSADELRWALERAADCIDTSLLQLGLSCIRTPRCCAIRTTVPRSR